MADLVYGTWGCTIDEGTGFPSAVSTRDMERQAPAAAPPRTASPSTGAGGRSFDLAVDAFLVARAKRGDRAAIETLFRTFEKPVYTLARRLCGNSHDAEDVVQESLLEVFRSLRQFRGDGSFAGWVRRITVSKALMKLRKNRSLADREPLDNDLAPAAIAGEQEAATARLDVAAALARLSDLGRTVVWLHEVEGYSHEEIGALMGKTASFSKSQLARAHTRMRTFMTAGGKEASCI